MGYRASTVVTYHTEVTGHVPSMRGHLAWGAGVPPHCKWSPEEREEMEPRMKAGKLAAQPWKQSPKLCHAKSSPLTTPSAATAPQWVHDTLNSH